MAQTVSCKIALSLRHAIIFQTFIYILKRLYSKSSLTLALKEWRFNLSFPRVWVLFLNSWSTVHRHVVRYDTNPPAIQKQHWHSREVQIEPALFECERAFRIQAGVSCSSTGHITQGNFCCNFQRHLWHRTVLTIKSRIKRKWECMRVWQSRTWPWSAVLNALPTL
jgi:hypothetical protein